MSGKKFVGDPNIGDHLTKEQRIECAERQYYQSKRASAKSKCRKVIWDGQIFESCRSLGKHLKLTNHDVISSYVRRQMPLKGFVPEYYKGES